MKTLLTSSHHRGIWAAAVAFVVAVGLFRLSPINPGAAPVQALITRHLPGLSTPSAKAAVKLPFSIKDVVAFLSDNFQIQPVEERSNYALFRYFETQPGGTPEELMQMTVRSQPEHLSVSFTLHEGALMPYVAEFIECPLFTPVESQQLYAQLYAPSSRSGWHDLGRFSAKAAMMNTPDGTEVIFDFAPRNSAH